MKRQFIPPVPFTYRLFGKALDLPWLDTLFVCDYPAAKAGVWHEHDGIELIFRIRGESGYEFTEHARVSLLPENALVIPPRTNHRLASEIDSPGLRICFLLRNRVRNADKSALINSEAFQRCLESLISRAYLPQPLSVNLIQRLTLLTNLVARQADDSDLLRQTQLRVIATDLLVALATADIVTRDSSNAVIDRTLAYLAERLDQKIRMDDLLNYVGYGQSQFFRLFRQQTGLTPTAWITRCRIRRACELLRNTSEPVRQIAAQVGCPDASYFCRLFKHHIGKTPLDYRTARSGGLGV